MALNRRHFLASPALLIVPAACGAPPRDLVDLLPDGADHPGAALMAHRARDNAVMGGASGDLGTDTPYFGASSTKLYVTAMLLQLVEEGRLNLKTPFRRYIDGRETERLNTFGGEDRTGEITIRQLMAHTSGLPDFLEPENTKTGLFQSLVRGRDRKMTFSEAMEITRRLGAVGPPGKAERAVYSDTNYQILGRVIEALDGVAFATAFERRISHRLGLSTTWIYNDPADTRPRPLRYGASEMRIPEYMAFTQADGGVVTTAREGLTFTRAFFEGALFNKARIADLEDFRPMFFPLEYGTGMMRFSLPGAMTAFRKIPPMLGHSGLSGAVLFHMPERGLTFAGTVNQVDQRSAAYQLLAKAALLLDAAG